MIGWNATLRSLAVVTAGAVVTYCGWSVLMTCQQDRAHAVRKAPASVHGCHKAKTKRAKPSPLKVDVAQFGMPHFSEEGELAFTETDQIPLVAGTSFGWRLHLDGASTAKHRVTMKEVFVLPTAPATWGIGPATALSDDLTTATTRRKISLDASAGWISSSWTVSAGDPAGRYQMMVFLDDQLVKTFEFDVVAQKAKNVKKAKRAKRVKKAKRIKRGKSVRVEVVEPFYATY